MDSVQIASEDNGKSWTAFASKDGLPGARLAVFTQFTEALQFAHDMTANISRDRHLMD